MFLLFMWACAARYFHRTHLLTSYQLVQAREAELERTFDLSCLNPFGVDIWELEWAADG